MLIKKSIVLAIAIGTLSGCANFHAPSKSTTIENGKSYWLSYDASRRGGIILSNGSKTFSCSEPAPDVALSFVNTLKGSLTTPGGLSAKDVEASFNATAQALAGRDDVVLLAREALFRICEAHMNDAIGKRDVGPLFMDVFTQIKQIAVAQAQKAESKAKEAEKNLESAKIKAGITK